MVAQKTSAIWRSALALGIASALACASAGCDTNPGRARARNVEKRAAAKVEPAQPAAEPAPAPAPAAAADGLAEVDGPGLIERIRKSGRKGTIVNVWASWCGSCKRELPMLIDLAKALEPDGIQLLLVSADEPAKRPEAAAMLATFPSRPEALIVKGALGPFKRAVDPEWQGAVPSTFLYDGEGQLQYKWLGPTLEHEIAPIITAYLAGQPLEAAAAP